MGVRDVGHALDLGRLIRDKRDSSQHLMRSTVPVHYTQQDIVRHDWTKYTDVPKKTLVNLYAVRWCSPDRASFACYTESEVWHSWLRKPRRSFVKMCASGGQRVARWHSLDRRLSIGASYWLVLLLQLDEELLGSFTCEGQEAIQRPTLVYIFFSARWTLDQGESRK